MFDTLTDSFKKSLLKADVHHKVVKDLISSVELETKKMRPKRTEWAKTTSCAHCRIS